jgi:hypothetical protein
MALLVCDISFILRFQRETQEEAQFRPQIGVAESFCTPTLPSQSVRPGIRSLPLMKAG